MDKSELTNFIKTLAKEYGFVKCGIAPAEKLDSEFNYLKHWVEAKRSAEMSWLERSLEKRTNPSLILEDVKSIISLAYLYDTKEMQPFDNNIAKVSRYAWGNIDYHKVLKNKLKEITNKIVKVDDQIKARYYVDDGPVMEKVWAVKAGIGWMGKNTNVIDPEIGSFFFLSEILINKELLYDHPIEDLCETCSICINACPTGALIKEYELDASLCISYLTIENRGDIPEYIDLNGWIFGCDICQDVCPYNKHKFLTNEAGFLPRKKIYNKPLDELLKITEEEFNQEFATSPIKRAKYKGFKRNILHNIKKLNTLHDSNKVSPA